MQPNTGAQSRSNGTQGKPWQARDDFQDRPEMLIDHRTSAWLVMGQQRIEQLLVLDKNPVDPLRIYR
jgi:hypothetical protein